MYFIVTDPAKLASSLEAWAWIGLDGKKPIRVTAFADVFLKDRDGIWFLDTIEGKLGRVCSNEVELEELLASAEGRDKYLFAGFVERADREGRTLAPGECYDFKISPILGGSVDYENVQKQDLAVTLHIAGQIHQKVRGLRPGTKISAVTVDDAVPTIPKPWWKVW